MDVSLARLRHPVFVAASFWSVSLSAALPGAEEADPPGAYKAPSPEPSPVETVMLEYINRCRANPAEDGARCAADKSVPPSVDLKMFAQEMFEAKSAPPLVFDLKLLKAARWHSHYQILHGQGHDEIAGREGFTGQTPGARIARAGASTGGVAENAFVGPKDPWYCHLGFVVDWGSGGPGGMQLNRGHRRNILGPRYRVVGVGAVPYDGDKKFACTHNFATSSQRFVGGVVLNDRNRNRFYDIGEGISGVAMSSGDQKMKSWYSGAYTLAIDSTKAKMTVEIEGKTYAAMLGDGDENVKFDVYLSDRALYDRAGMLLTALKQVPAGEANDARRLIAGIDLYFGTRGTLVDASILDEVEGLVGPVRRELEGAMNDVRNTLTDGTIEEARKVARAASQKYARTKARPWFADALASVDIKEGHQRMSDLRQANKPIPKSVLTRTLTKQQQLYQQLTTGEWKKAAKDWAEKTAGLQAK
jgi:hypothetical protein